MEDKSTFTHLSITMKRKESIGIKKETRRSSKVRTVDSMYFKKAAVMYAASVQRNFSYWPCY